MTDKVHALVCWLELLVSMCLKDFYDGVNEKYKNLNSDFLGGHKHFSKLNLDLAYSSWNQEKSCFLNQIHK